METQEKTPKIRSAAFSAFSEVFAGLPAKVRLTVILRASLSVLIASVLCYPVIIEFVIRLNNGFWVAAPLIYLTLAKWGAVREFARRITWGSSTELTTSPAELTTEIAPLILSLDTVTIKALESRGIPFQKANGILKELTDAGLLVKDKSRGNARVVKEGVEESDIDRVLSGDVAVNSYLSPFTIQKIS